MIFVVIIVIAIAAFVMWSKAAAKSAKAKYLQAHNNALVERMQGKYSKPSWWNWQDRATVNHVKEIVKPLIHGSGLSPVAMEAWLEADETFEDFLTFMAHAERAGFKQVEQIALLPDFAASNLKVDLFHETTINDKNVLLYLIAATKQRHQQNHLDIPDISSQVVQDYLVARGATFDEEMREYYPCFYYDFDYRSVVRNLHFVEGCSPASITVYDNAPNPYLSFHPAY